MKQSIQPELNESARHILSKRYLLKDRTGKVIESPEGMFSRVAKWVASAEKEWRPERQAKSEEEFFDAMMRLEFLPTAHADECRDRNWTTFCMLCLAGR